MTFFKKLFLKSLFPNTFCACMFFTYAWVTSQLHITRLFGIARFTLLMYLSCQFILAPIVDYILFSNVSKQLDRFENGELTLIQRTNLLITLTKQPIICLIKTEVYFIIGTISVIYMMKQINLSSNIITLMAVNTVVQLYLVGIMTHNYCNKICSSYSRKIVAAGIDNNYIAKTKHLGVSCWLLLTYYVSLPLLVFGVSSAISLTFGYNPYINMQFNLQKLRVILTLILNSPVIFYGASAFSSYFEKDNDRVTKVFEEMISKNLKTDAMLEPDLQSDISYTYYMMNKLISMLRKTRENGTEVGKSLTSSSMNLISIANETETTSMEQSTGISEIGSTMDSTGHLSTEIGKSITEITELTAETAENVSSGLNVLKFSLDKMEQIEHANSTTITEIRNLSTKINRIWEIINLINSIADQTKIIAFNAELESVNAGKSGKNFRNVANEIRRLANNTMDSTSEIKKRMNEMQFTANNLINSSLDTTKQIKHGYELAQLLENNFISINSSVNENALSSGQIKDMMEQQTVGFNQIIETVQQVNLSIQGFTNSMRSIIGTANDLKDNAHYMESTLEAKEDETV